MKESVQCSLTCAIDHINNNLEKYGIENLKEYLEKKWKSGFHVHAPSGATPKDGPSAGCAFTTAFISRILEKKINHKVAMTGEIDLLGFITKIGGLEYKINGAKKALNDKHSLNLDDFSNKSISVDNINIKNKLKKISNLVKEIKRLK